MDREGEIHSFERQWNEAEKSEKTKINCGEAGFKGYVRRTET